MKTELINLSSTYTYIRCDSEFELLFTNGQKMPMWRGFYCFRTEQLQEYNTNGQLIIQSNDDNCNMWWLCTNTLIMSVTDINNEALNGIGQLVSGLTNISANNALANLNQLDLGIRQVNLLESIQNTLSIFINAYVEANSVHDFGFITATINNDLVVNVFIAKSNKYSFNCSVVFNHNFLTNLRGSTSGIATGKDAFPLFDNSILYNIVVDNYSISPSPSATLHIGLKSNKVNFSLYNNDNVLLSGYSLSNFVVSNSFYMPACYLFTYFEFPSYSWNEYINEISLNHSSLPISSDSSFNLSMSSYSNVLSPTESGGSDAPVLTVPVSCNETMTINFDVSKT